MQLNRDTATVVGDRQEALGIEMHVDEVRVAGHRFVHRVVDDFGKEMMQRLLVGTTDIHAGTHAHRLEAFQHADGGCTVIVAAG